MKTSEVSNAGSRRAAALAVALGVVVLPMTARAQEPASGAQPPAQAVGSAPTPPSPVPTAAAGPAIVYVHDERPSVLGSRYRSPGLAAALSLTPVPVDFGNLYAENVGWGMAYTGAELALGTGMMWLGTSHMCHDRSDCGDWSGAETAGMATLVGAYVSVKILAGVHASSAARDFNEARGTTSWYPIVAPTAGGAGLSLARRF